VCAEDVASKVYPSGSALATAAAPIVVLARAVLDDHRLAELRRKALRYGARENVRRAPRCQETTM